MSESTLEKEIFNQESFQFYKSIIKTDKTKLDEECVTQPFFYQEISEITVYAKEYYDSVSLNKLCIESDIKQEIRKNVVSGVKLTEGSITEQTNSNPLFTEASQALIYAKRDYDLWKGLLDSWNQRASSLKLLVKVLGEELYAIQNNHIVSEEEQHNSARNLIKNDKQSKRRGQPNGTEQG